MLKEQNGKITVFETVKCVPFGRHEVRNGARDKYERVRDSVKNAVRTAVGTPFERRSDQV